MNVVINRAQSQSGQMYFTTEISLATWVLYMASKGAKTSDAFI